MRLTFIKKNFHPNALESTIYVYILMIISKRITTWQKVSIVKTMIKVSSQTTKGLSIQFAGSITLMRMYSQCTMIKRVL